MRKLLVNFDSNWADEMDVEAFVVVSKKSWDKNMKMAKENWPDNGVEVYIGTNEQLDFYSFEEFESCLKLTELKPVEVKTLEKLFDGAFGFHDIFDHVFDTCRSNSEEDDEEDDLDED